jgi:hypothetical protein
MNHAEGLQVMVLHLDPSPGAVGIELLPFDPDVLDEARRQLFPMAHERGP